MNRTREFVTIFSKPKLWLCKYHNGSSGDIPCFYCRNKWHGRKVSLNLGLNKNDCGYHSFCNTTKEISKKRHQIITTLWSGVQMSKARTAANSNCETLKGQEKNWWIKSLRRTTEGISPSQSQFSSVTSITK